MPIPTAPTGVEVRLTTTAMSTDGRAVARLESGKVTFVEGALPGETVLAVVRAEKASFAWAEALRVEEPSPDRIAPPCPHAVAGCGGCQWQHVSLEGQLRLKASMIRDSLARIAHVEEVQLSPTVELPPWGGRTTIRAGVVDGRVSLRRLSSHDEVPIEGCLVAHPLLLPYMTGRRYPRAKAVTLRCGARTGEVLVEVTPAAARRDLPAEVRRDHFYEEAAGRRWRVSARSFFQSRPDGADALADVVRAAAGPGRGRKAVDAYSGVGLFAGVLADGGWSVTALEGARQAAEDAQVNLSGLDATTVRADVGRWAAKPADLVVADPSRNGLGREAAASLARTGAARLVLISCDVASLARDAGLLMDLGYRLVGVTPVDMFPHTRHIEAVSVFDLR